MQNFRQIEFPLAEVLKTLSTGRGISWISSAYNLISQHRSTIQSSRSQNFELCRKLNPTFLNNFPHFWFFSRSLRLLVVFSCSSGKFRHQMESFSRSLVFGRNKEIDKVSFQRFLATHSALFTSFALSGFCLLAECFRSIPFQRILSSTATPTTCCCFRLRANLIKITTEWRKSSASLLFPTFRSCFESSEEFLLQMKCVL